MNASLQCASQTALSINRLVWWTNTLGFNIDFNLREQYRIFSPWIQLMEMKCIVSWIHDGSFYLDGFVQHIDAGGNSLLAANGQKCCPVAGHLLLGNIASQDWCRNIYAFYLHLQSCMHRRSMSMAIFYSENGALLASTSILIHIECCSHALEFYHYLSGRFSHTTSTYCCNDWHKRKSCLVNSFAPCFKHYQY